MLRSALPAARLLPFLTALVLATPALAGHLYVDSTHGLDTNPGTSPALPFKHIFKALQVGGTSNDVVHLAPGEYSAATGEHFPLALGATRLTGDEGPAVTFILGTGNDILLDAVKPAGVTAKLDIDGLSLVGGRTGLRVNSPSGIYQVTLQDVSFDGMSQDGVEAHAIPSGAGSQLNLGLFRGTISHCLRGLTFQISSPTMKSVLALGSIDFVDNTIALNGESAGDVIATTTSCRVVGNSLNGLRFLANGGSVDFNVQGCLIASNGVGIESGGLGGTSTLDVRYCTIADNGVGLTTSSFPTPPVASSIDGSILWNNGDDVALGGPMAATFTDVSDGDFGGRDGNLSVDPQFRDEPAGDYRLSWGSPMIEAAGPRQAIDLVGTFRPTDGDLDVTADNDLGCLEFAPLDMISPAAVPSIPALPLGGTLRLEAWGPAGATAVLFVTPSKPIPQPTKFGVLWLDLAFFFPLAVLPVGPTTPGVFEATVPNDPELFGSIPVLQTLTTSPIAPKGKALSNMTIFSIE